MYRFTFGLLLFFAPALAQNTIQGNVYASDVRGMVVIACLFNSSTSDCNYEKSQYVAVNSDGSYLLTNLEPAQYVIIAWRDINNNKNLDEGQDDIGYYTSADGQLALVTPPASNIAVQVTQASAPSTNPLGPMNPLTEPPTNPLTTPTPPNIPSNALVGEWSSGSRLRYVFTTDGSYEFNGLLQSSLNNCTTSFFFYETGHYAIQETVLVLTPQVNKRRDEDNCSSNSNSEKDLPLETKYRLVHFGQFQPTGEVTLELTYLILNAQGQLEVDPENSETAIFYREPQ